MTEDDKIENSIIPIGSTDLVRVSNSISVTNKLLTESKFQFSGDFKGEQIWKIDAHSMAIRKIILPYEISELNYTKAIVSASEDGNISLWDIESGKLYATFPIDRDWLTSLCLWKDQNNYTWIFCAGKSGKIHKVGVVYPCAGSDNINAHDLIIQSLAVSDDSKHLASGSWDDRIKIWDPDNLELRHNFVGHNLGVNDLLFLPDNQTLVSCGKDEKIKIWDFDRNIQIAQLDGHSHWVEAIAYNKLKNTLASGSCDNSIKIWNIEKQTCLLSIENKEWINDLSFSPNGDYLVANCYNGISKVFDTKSFQLICEYNEHSKVFPYNHSIKREATNWIYSVIFDESSKAIFTASVDGSIHKWK